MSFPISIDEVKKIIDGEIDLDDVRASSHLTYFDVLYEYYRDEMPYGVQKARTGDPEYWIIDRLSQKFI